MVRSSSAERRWSLIRECYNAVQTPKVRTDSQSASVLPSFFDRVNIFFGDPSFKYE